MRLDLLFFPKLIEEFEAENPDIKIELNNVNVESSDAEYQAAISDNSLPDMFITDAFSMNELVDLDLVHELNSVFPEEAQEEYTEGVFDEGNTRIGDNIYLFPIFKGGTYMMYYNKTVLDDLGIDTVPETWDELLAVGKEVYEKSDGNTEGLIFGGTSGWLVDAFVQLMATELSPESRMDYVNGEYSFNNEGNVETIEFLKEMLDEHALSQLTLETNSTVAREYFAVGRTAFLIDETGLVNYWKMRMNLVTGVLSSFLLKIQTASNMVNLACPVMMVCLYLITPSIGMK